MTDQFRYSQYRNFFDVVVDDEIVGKVALEQGEQSVELVSGLEPGEHTLRLVRRTEPQIGEWTVLGLEIGGVLLDPGPAPERKIIVIGDSITAGSGVEATNNSAECSEGAFGEAGTGWGIPYHNAHRSYGALAGEILDAEYHILGVSGIGLIRNYTSVYDTRPMPDVYDLIYLEKDPLEGQTGGGGVGGVPEVGEEHLWDPEWYVPQAIVVALGTNDFSPGDNPPTDPRPDMEVPAFVEEYIAFVDRLRGYYPEAHVFGMSSPMLGDGWPSSDDTFRTDQRDAIEQVDAHYEDAGFANFHPIWIDKVPGGGCGTHPDVEEHEEMAEIVATAISDALSW
jgi:lysophospholipase L1-like esterase